VFAGSVAGEPPGAPPPEPDGQAPFRYWASASGASRAGRRRSPSRSCSCSLLGVDSSSFFLGSYNLFTLCTNIGDLALMALPMTLIVMVGEIDLSVASTLALSGEALGYLWMPPLADGARSSSP
jgi:hypothetical protein